MRWNKQTSEYEELPKVDAFINEVIEVCKKHGFCIGHEDEDGAFVIYDGDSDLGWIEVAHYEPEGGGGGNKLL